ncbi:MAG: hypothetical protein AB7N80_11605 [Bdellovibrionales bacterium]
MTKNNVLKMYKLKTIFVTFLCVASLGFIWLPAFADYNDSLRSNDIDLVQPVAPRPQPPAPAMSRSQATFSTELTPRCTPNAAVRAQAVPNSDCVLEMASDIDKRGSCTIVIKNNQPVALPFYAQSELNQLNLSGVADKEKSLFKETLMSNGQRPVMQPCPNIPGHGLPQIEQMHIKVKCIDGQVYPTDMYRMTGAILVGNCDVDPTTRKPKHARPLH